MRREEVPGARVGDAQLAGVDLAGRKHEVSSLSRSGGMASSVGLTGQAVSRGRKNGDGRWYAAGDRRNERGGKKRGFMEAGENGQEIARVAACLFFSALDCDALTAVCDEIRWMAGGGFEGSNG